MADVNDQYPSAYAEKLWELIPAWHRELDGTAEPPGVLRALVEIVAEQAAVLRRSQDRLWEDQWVERADDWALPYLGDLVATRMVSSMLPRAQRIDVAKTVYYRRRAGTLRVLEELIFDIAGWEGVVTEGFRRLARMPHGLDPVLGAGGRWSGTPQGGLADLRRPLGAEVTATPWDEFAHTPDLRKPRGRDGQHGIPRLVFHLYRLVGAPIAGVTPHVFTAGPTVWHTFDPSGRDVPLFARRTRSQALSNGVSTPTSAVFRTSSLGSGWEEWTRARPWQVPAPIRCRLLGSVRYDLEPEALAAVRATLGAAEQAALDRIAGQPIRGEDRLALRLATTTPPLSAVLAAIREDTLAPDCGKAALLEPSTGSIRVTTGAGLVTVAETQADELATPDVTFAAWQALAIDAERGRFVLRPTIPTPDLLTDHVVGTRGSVGALPIVRTALPWADPELLASLPQPPVLVAGGGAVPGLGVPSGVVEITDQRTYTSAGNLANVDRAAVRSTDGGRPYLSLNRNWRFTASVLGNAVLLLDGLWVGARGAPREVVLRGNWERVEIRGCTFDPGGTAADGSVIPPMGLRIEGQVERLVVQSSVLSAVTVTGFLGRLEVNDSILQAAVPIDLGAGSELHVARSTVFGLVRAWRMWASDSLFSGNVQAVDTQNGCFRFSGAHQSSLDHVPHPYQSVFFADASALFTSTTFGDPWYAVLSGAPEVALVASPDDLDGNVSLHTGASNDGEMGAYNGLLDPIKQRALAAKVEEFLPFGLLPSFLHET